MLVNKDVALRAYNTFGVDARASEYAELSHTAQLKELNEIILHTRQPLLVLGGGSNILFTHDFEGLVVRVLLRGITIEKQTNEHIYIRAMAGENWESFVEYCVGNGWGGLENLTMIPGNVGTSPMQNIGAYGVEIKDVFHCLEAFEFATGKMHTFSHADCRFGYRDSFFKQEGKNRFLITSVCFKLTVKNHKLRMGYGSVQQELERAGITDPRISDVMNAIQSIRSSKLPDPKELGNAGSFFKNPVIPREQYDKLQEQWPTMPAYESEPGRVKTAAGWLIEMAGWKGYRTGDAGVHSKQALVLVNYGNASGSEILNLAREIQQSVWQKFGIEIEMEVNII